MIAPKFKRSAGVLMPVSSLPSAYGIGCFSRDAETFADMAKDMGFSWWQVLPITILGAGNSPYSGYSTHAGNFLYINPMLLKEEGLFLFPQNGDFWIIKKMENATEEELSRDPFLEVDTQEEYFATENEPWEENVLNEGRQQSDARENSDEETLPLGMPKNSLPENTSAFTENKTSEEENQGWTGLPSFLRRKEEESGLPPAPETINTPPPLPLF